MAEINPVGGSGGMLKKDPAAGVQNVIAVLVGAGVFIDMLQLIVRLKGGPAALVQHGGHGGHMAPFVLADNEYLTGISGRSSLYINSITLHTNMRESQRFGGSTGERERVRDSGPILAQNPDPDSRAPTIGRPACPLHKY